MSEIIIQFVQKGLFISGIAVSDGKTYRAWREKTKTYKALLRVARDTTLELPVFFSEKHKPYNRLRKILDEGTSEPDWKAGREGPWAGHFSHSLPNLKMGRSERNSWWSKTTPVDFACPKCSAPFPTFGDYYDGYYHCAGCGHRDLDFASVGL